MLLEDANYCLVGRRAEGRITLLSQGLADGGRAVLVFCKTDAAEAFRIVEGLAEEWEVMERATDGITDLLDRCALMGAKYVCLDPPTALTRGTEEESRVIPLEAFLDHLAPEEP
ncbi:MAG: hypothetical protein M3P70_08960 [Actinomycetota bacterium]|nr:hypothetical protein [Actinomycetota bacterium]